ncbi:hypothetical protein [Streptomyces sp. CBMA123]|uniref:hypothetical protein n=1 Tax=Streptomyces sp. CBMA123 TaxID=1896313 RepID=UPI001661D19B|nr:hypothetical protein [Streptomyces sp. CBMA123]MBD0692959.1 hypothetical protein [Streptomyces sp. CBMA123]
MRRRICRRILGVVLPVATGMLALSAPAQAATGLLVVNGVPHDNPQRGCYPVTSPVSLQNHTGSPVLVHAAANCQGPVTAEVDPGQSVRTFGASYFVF